METKKPSASTDATDPSPVMRNGFAKMSASSRSLATTASSSLSTSTGTRRASTGSKALLHRHNSSTAVRSISSLPSQLLEEWRTGRRLSDGASARFLSIPTTSRSCFRNSVVNKQRPPPRRRTLGPTTFLACLVDDLKWAFQELLLPDEMEDEDDEEYDDDEEHDDLEKNHHEEDKKEKHNRQTNQHHKSTIPSSTTTTTTTTTTLSGKRHAIIRMPSPRTLERWAVFLYMAHSDNPRGFHSIARIFETTAAATPIQWLSACFRDCILINIDLPQQDDDDDDNDNDDGDDDDDDDDDPNNKYAIKTATSTSSSTTCPPLPTQNPKVLHDIFEEEESSISKYILNATTLQQEPDVRMVAMIFGYEPGQDLQDSSGRHQGLDAFLSAICASRLLRPTLSLTHLAQVAICLEAHIPFRNMESSSETTTTTTTTNTTNTNTTMTSIPETHHQHPHEKHHHHHSLHFPPATSHHHHSASPSSSSSSSSSSTWLSSPVLERLYQRLVHVNQVFSLHMSEQDIVRSVQQGADFANRGLGNLASNDPQVFLQHMWSLLPEQFESLRRQFLYTLLDLHTAVQGMRHFFGTLLPKLHCHQPGCHTNSLFSCFRGIPDAREMKHFHEQVQYNVAIGYEYLLAQCVSLRVVAALARLTGGAGAPMSFFFGDQPHTQPRPDDEFKMIRLGEALFVMEFGEQQVQDEDDEEDDEDDEEDDEDGNDDNGYNHVESHKRQQEDFDPKPPNLVANGTAAAKGSDYVTDATRKQHNQHYHNRERETEPIRSTVLRILQEDCWGTHVYNFLDPRNAYLAAYLYKKLDHTQMERIASQPLDDSDCDGDEDGQELDLKLLQQHVPIDEIELIAEDLGHIAVTRRYRLDALVQGLRRAQKE